MVNIDLLTLGNEMKDAQGDIYKVISNFSEGKKIYIELEKQVMVGPAEELIPEKI